MTTNTETTARLSVALETFKMTTDDQLLYPRVRVVRVDSIYTDGTNSGGRRYTSNKGGTWETISYQPLVGLNGTQLVVCRVAGEDSASTSYGVYSEDCSTYTRLTIDEVQKLFLKHDTIEYVVYLEAVVALIAIAASKLSLVSSS